MLIKPIHATVLLVSLVAACDGAEPVSARVSLTTSGLIPGYVHAFEHSGFRPGGALASNTLARTQDGAIAKIVGSDGVFALDTTNGFTRGIPNGGAPSTLRGPYPGTALDHHAKALAYFRKAGLPPDQIGPVQVRTLMRGGQPANGERGKDVRLAYYSIITRQVNDVPVAESFAWVRFNIDGDVVDEGVYWPELPGSLLDEIGAFKDMMSDDGRRGRYRDAVESHAAGYGLAPQGRIVAHHRSPTDHGDTFAHVYYDANIREPRGRTRHFDISGAETELPRRHVVPPSVRGGTRQ